MIKVVQVDADAYVAILDEAGAFTIDGRRVSIANSRPRTPSPQWRESFLTEGPGDIRWTIAVYDGQISSGSDRDPRAVKALGAIVVPGYTRCV